MTESPVAMLREYSDHIEAETIRIRLAAAGIRAFVTGTDAATALGLGGAATQRMVQVKVSRNDYEQAAALLEEDQRRIVEVGPWICSRCAEQNEAAFEVCWSCSKPRGEDDKRGRIDDPPPADATAGFSASVQVEPTTTIADTDANPYRPVLLDGDERGMNADNASSKLATRCFRAAIVGAIVFPPLVSFYALILLTNVNPDAYRDRRLRKKLILAWGINLLAIPGWLYFWSGTFVG